VLFSKDLRKNTALDSVE